MQLDGAREVPEMITVLVLASSPIGEGPLQLGKEHKLIKHSLDSATNRDQFRIVSCAATTVDDLRRYMVEHSPTIVHFCGHGAGTAGLCFEDDNGHTDTIDGSRLAKLLHLVNEDVKCVVLNACYSELQAKPISSEIDFVVGMKDAIGDQAALKFAQGFYEAIWAGQSFEKAFKFGCSAIDTAHLPEEHIPVLLRSPRLGGTRLNYAEDTQRLENFLLGYLNSQKNDKAVLTTMGEAIIEARWKAWPKVLHENWTSVVVLGVAPIDPNIKEVSFVARGEQGTIERVYYLVDNSGSYLVDWDASLGYWPIPAQTFIALGSSRPIAIRVLAQLSGYFNYGFDRDHFVSVELRDTSNKSFHGYIAHGHEDRRELVKLLYDGQFHRIIVEALPSTENNTHLLITRFVSDSWVAPEST
jgi:hypothetical protein